MSGQLKNDIGERKLRVTLLSAEWKASSDGDLTTINRELAIQMAKHPNVEVSVFLPWCSEEDKKDADNYNVKLIKAVKLPGLKPVLWLASVPDGHAMDCVVGHGVALGQQIPLIKNNPNYTHCKWIQVVHTAPEEIGMYKNISEGQQMQQTEIELCEMADQVVTIGLKLTEAYKNQLGKKDVFNLTPSILSEFSDVQQASDERRTFCALVIESGDSEDFDVKGYKIAAKAIANLKDKSYQLKFASKQSGKEDELKHKLLQCGIDHNQLIICSFDENRKTLANLFSIVDIVLLPSKTEGFGLSALKAISAGLPVLVSGNSGIAEALREVPNGSQCIVDSEDPADWARAIKAVRNKKRNVQLAEAKILRENYLQQFSWKEWCAFLVEKMCNLAFGGELNITVGVEDSKPEEQNMQTGMLATESARYQEVQPPRASATSAVSGSVSYSQREHFEVFEKEIFLSIAGNYLRTTPPQSPEERNRFKEYMKEMRLIITGVSVGSLVITVKCESLMILEELWTDYSSGRLGEVVQNCFVTEKILKELNLAELRLKTTIDVKEYNACKMFFEKVALRDALSSEFHSTSSTSESPQKKEQWEKSEQKTKIMETGKLEGTSALTVVPITGHGKELEEPWGRKGMLPLPGSSTLDPEEELEEPHMKLQRMEGNSPSTLLSTSGHKRKQEVRQSTVKLQEKKGMLPLPESSTFDPEEELEEPPMKLQRKEEFSTRNNKISVRRSKITEEGGVLMAQNVPSRVMIPPKAVPTCTEVTCFLWNLQILSPPLGRNEALVSSVMELACGSIPGTEKRYEFNVKVKLALSHSASDIKGYELVIKELIDEKTNDWRDLETRWAWTPSDIKDEHSGVEEFPDWLFPFAEAEITSFSSFAVVWRLKSFTFKNPSTLSSSFPCILSDHPGVSVTFPESSLPTGQTFALTIKVQEVPCSNAKLKERLVAGPILHISPSKPVQLLAPAWLTIPVILGEDIPKCLDYSATDVRIFCRTSEEDEREWNEVTEQLENIAVLENGTVTFTLNHFSEYWVWIDPLKRSFAILKNLANDLYRKLMLQQVGLFARLYARGNPPNYVLTLCCFPLHLKEQVYTPLSPVPRNVCAQGGGNSLKPLCKADQISVSLSKAFTLMQEENLDNFLTFLGTEPFERSLPVSIIDLNNLQVELYMGNQYYRETLCTLYFVPTVPDQTSSLRNLPSTAQVAMPEQKEDQVALEFSTAFPSPKALEETDSSISSKKVLKVAILADEWNSLKGGLSTFNRELAIHLASCSGTQVTFLVPHGACGMEEKAAAAKNCVTIIEPKKLIASPPPVELFFPPKDLRIDVIIGHGVKLGQQAQIIRESHDCKWVQVVHTAPDELGMHKDCAEAIAQSEEKNQREVSLCEIADLVMAVGPKLKGFYSNHLRSFNKDQNVVEFTPGIMRDLIDVQQSLNENDVFQVLIFGRGDDEDFKLKGYDIAAGAFASHELKNDSYHLTFVGAAPGKQDEFAAKILQHGISKNQLSVKEYIKDRNRLKELLLRMDLVIMPSRTEGFGLTALEALSAGLPVLAGHNSGFSNALQKVGFGELCVINSDKPEDWSKAIKKVRKKERNKRLDEMQQLRKSYGQKYNWAEQCEILVKEMRRKVFA